MNPEDLAPWLRLQALPTLYLALKTVLRELLRRGEPMYHVQRAVDSTLAIEEKLCPGRR